MVLYTVETYFTLLTNSLSKKVKYILLLNCVFIDFSRVVSSYILLLFLMHAIRCRNINSTVWLNLSWTSEWWIIIFRLPTFTWNDIKLCKHNIIRLGISLMFGQIVTLLQNGFNFIIFFIFLFIWSLIVFLSIWSQ